jgi:ankyrin repeat protein
MADSNEIDKDGRTPLLQTSASGNFPLAEKLIESGSDPNITGEKINTPLILASYFGHLPIVKILTKAKAGMHEQDCNGSTANQEIRNGQEWTPLMLAAYSNQLSVLKYLIDKGANIDETEKIGDTALILAAQQGSHQCALELMRSGADKEIKSKNGGTAYSRALSNKLKNLEVEINPIYDFKLTSKKIKKKLLDFYNTTKGVDSDPVNRVIKLGTSGKKVLRKGIKDEELDYTDVQSKYHF